MRRALVGVVGLAALLRLGQALARWDEVSLAYAAYQEPVASGLGRGDWAAGLGTWVGLHPPLYSWVFAALETLAPVPLVWLGLSAALSALAVVWVGREAGGVGALVLAGGLLQVRYAAELNNYPLAVAALALVLRQARGPWPPLAAAVVLAGWSHVLGGCGALGALAWRLARRDLARADALRLVAAVGLGLAPVAVGALRRVGQGSTWGQAGLHEPLAWGRALGEALGWEGVALAALALPGLGGLPGAALGPVALVLVGSLIAGAASPAQFPYLLLLGPPLALGAARTAARSRAWGAAVVGLGLVAALHSARDVGGRLVALAEDAGQERAVSRAWTEARAGDAVWLVAPALEPDDDKTAISPALWRIPPWVPWRRVWPTPLEYTDPRVGAPRRVQGRIVMVSTDLDASAFDAIAGAILQQGGAIWVALYDAEPAPDLLPRVQRVLRPYRAPLVWTGPSRPLGADRLWRVEGR